MELRQSLSHVQLEAHRRIQILYQNNYSRIENYKRVLIETLAGLKTYQKNGYVEPIPLDDETSEFIRKEIKQAELNLLLLRTLKDYDYKYSHDMTCRQDIGVHREKIYLAIRSKNGRHYYYTKEDEKNILKFCTKELINKE